MPERNSGVSSASNTALQGLVSEMKDKVKKAKEAGIRVPRAEKKKSPWMDSNTGVRERAMRDVAQDAADKRKAEDARANLQKKSELYNKLKRRKDAGLTDQQLADMLVVFDEKTQDYSSDSESDGAEDALPDDDPEVEYIDDLGRSRWARRSEIPEEYRPLRSAQDKENDGEVIRGPFHLYRVAELSADRQAEIRAESDKPMEVHYDATKENRAMGAGFIHLSPDEETRQKQLEDLRRETATTNEIRAANQAPRTPVEGMQADVTGKRGSGKRTRVNEERLKLIAEQRAKRQKVKVKEESTASSSIGEPTSTVASASSSATVDPFAAVEAKNSGEGASYDAAAEAFLAQLIP